MRGLLCEVMRASCGMRTIDSVYFLRIKSKGRGGISGEKIILFNDLICSGPKNPQIIFQFHITTNYLLRYNRKKYFSLTPYYFLIKVATAIFLRPSPLPHIVVFPIVAFLCALLATLFRPLSGPYFLPRLVLIGLLTSRPIKTNFLLFIYIIIIYYFL